MGLTLRLIRALFVFGRIFLSYLLQLGLWRLFRRWQVDPKTGREHAVIPDWLSRRRQRIDRLNARRMLRGILRLKGVYIKAGQVLSIMGGFLPPVYGEELEQLQDQVPPRPFPEIEKAFRKSFHKSPVELFERFDEQPLAAASLGQVHRAWLADGRPVAVKVLYPGIRGVIRVDMRVIRIAIRATQWLVPVANLERVHDALVDLLRRETDYTHEAACMRAMAANFEEEDDIVFPEPVDELTTSDILTMSFMEGVKITAFDQLERLGVDRSRIAERLIQAFYKMVFVDRLFHADPHPGNFLIQAADDGSPRIVILDFGAVSELPDHTVEGCLDILQGFFEGREELLLQGFDRIGFAAPTGDQELVRKTATAYFQKLLKIDARTPSALMNAKREDLEHLIDPEVERRRLRELMRSVQYPDGWFYVERAAVLMFWLVAQLDADLDTLQVGFPYVLPLIAERTAGQAPDPSSPEPSRSSGDEAPPPAPSTS
jgi:predicted unusual protein kinase regulating ubiquinone biosynthesis (AarF/ABC1/UbiB family)